MDELEDSDIHSEVVQPPVLPMIAIFSMLVIFLVAGTVLGNSTIEIPMDLFLPQGKKANEMQSAQQITIQSGAVRLTSSDQIFPLEVFAKTAQDHPLRQQLRARVQELARKKESPTTDPRTFYVVADRRTTYRTIFDVISFFREMGIETFLFVSEVKE